jgi:electron transport complex protein RnfD
LNLTVSPPPFIKKKRTSQKVVWSVVFALLPPVVAATYLFGARGLSVILICAGSCILTEAASQKISGKNITIHDGTALITGLILGLLLPFNTPLWIPFIGGVFAIGIAKQAFGGHGYNIFNPAISGWIFLMISWASLTLPPPVEYLGLQNLFLNRQAVRLVEASPVFVLLGGLFLFSTRLIKLEVPMGFFLGVSAPFLLIKGSLSTLYSGIFMLILFFVITDPVTSPITRRGRFLYGLLCGVMATAYSVFANFEDGLGLSLILLNALVPLIDRFTKPTPITLEGTNV